MSMKITFPGGLAVNAAFKGFTVATDQGVEHGGEGTAPEPFDLFLASLGTCAGLYALRFCEQRGIDTRGLGLTLTTETDREGKRLALVRLEI
ncbi:MAG TPA: OsmC family protein, partial [Thermoanaerobaculia bacterium]|nr:OsmC family protein [Thermoanaerobaculia bacterium]